MTMARFIKMSIGHALEIPDRKNGAVALSIMPLLPKVGFGFHRQLRPAIVVQTTSS
jgi:hypothetical protein